MKWMNLTMQDEQIEKGLRCCQPNEQLWIETNCRGCPYINIRDCKSKLHKDTLAYITRIKSFDKN